MPGGLLVRRLAQRAPAGLRKRVPLLDRLAGRSSAPFDRTAFAMLPRLDGPLIPLWTGYRRSIKRGWALYYWPAEALLRARARAAIDDSGISKLADELSVSRTLPASLSKLAAAARSVAAARPDVLRGTGVVDESIGRERVAAITSDDEIGAAADYHARNARRILARCRIDQRRLEASCVVEIGCGSGYTTYAMAALGAGEATGIDQDIEGHGAFVDRAGVQTRLGGGAARAHLVKHEAARLPFEADAVDLVHSSSVLEHIAEPAAAFAEIRRVLKPDGVAYFDVDPWFSPQGGHSLNTLDFPWGHVRLSPAEIDDYLRVHRPHEAAIAAAYYRDGFQSPRLTIGEIGREIGTAGLRIESWVDAPAHADHREWLTSTLVAECRRNYPAVSDRDLMTSGYSFLLRRR